MLGFTFASSLLAKDALRFCVYGNNNGANAVHSEVLSEAKAADVALFLIAGNSVNHEYGLAGKPDAVFDDYRRVFGSRENPLHLWPYTPGPAVFPVPGSREEQYYLPQDIAAYADSVGSRRSYEGTWEYGTRLYDSFYLEQMQIRVQPLSQQSKPLPRSPFGDYLLIVGTGTKKEAAIVGIYRTDRWGFKPEQISWLDSTMAFFRAEAPFAPIIAVAQDELWFLPDKLDEGTEEDPLGGVRGVSPELDRDMRARLHSVLVERRVDLAVAAGRGDYSVKIDNGLLCMTTGSAICVRSDSSSVATDNLWLEYSQTDSTVRVIVHPIESPTGCGLRDESAELGLAFEKHRAPNAIWRASNP